MKRLWILLSSAIVIVPACLALAGPAAANHGGSVTYTHGVASGDVTSTAVILWTRVDALVDTDLEAQVNDDCTFTNANEFTQTVTALTADDHTAKVDATGLSAATSYCFRFRHDNGAGDDFSPIGNFETAPSPSTASNLNFSYTADSDATTSSSSTAACALFDQTFASLGTIASSTPDFWIYLGDTIYSDSCLRAFLPDPPGPGSSTTVGDYRDAYKEARGVTNLSTLLGATSTYPVWDDHEVTNDYDGLTVNAAQYAAGREAFLEYMPVRESGLLNDPSCAGDPLYRTFKWGSDAELFILDERSCRSADVVSADPTDCPGNFGLPDLAPTLPTALRTEFPFSLFLTPSPDPDCLPALNDSSRTVLGPVQKQQFKDDLQNSTAKFKFIINEYPIQQLYALIYDRWEGYPAERAEVLDFIRDNDIENVEFLTTDTHANFASNVGIDRFTDPKPIVTEHVAGPIATHTFEDEVFQVGEGIAPGLGGLAVDSFNRALDIPWPDCRDLDVFSYADVNVDVSGGPGNETATVSHKDETGGQVTNQVTPTAEQCEKSAPGTPSIKLVDYDVTNDGTSSGGDISAVVMAFGSTSEAADLNTDGAATGGDISGVVQSFGLRWPPYNMTEGRTLDVWAKATDPDGDPLTLSVTDLPAGAAQNPFGDPPGPNNLRFRWAPSNTQGGVYYRVPFRVSDGTLHDLDGIPVDVDNNIP